MTNPVNIEAPEGLPFIEITREFDAPVETVFRAHEDRDLFAQWIGPDGYVNRIERWDFESGGGYRYINIDGENEYAFRGVFHTVRPHELVIQTFEFEGWPDAVLIESLTFESLDDGNRTRLVGRSVYPSVEARDGMVESGMEKGVVDGYRKLDALLAAG